MTERDILDVRGGFNRDFYGTEIGLPDLMANDVYNVQTGQLYLHKNEMLPGLDREARYNNESDFMKNHAWNVSTQYTHTFWNGAKLTDRLSYNNEISTILGRKPSTISKVMIRSMIIII